MISYNLFKFKEPSWRW